MTAEFKSALIQKLRANPEGTQLLNDRYPFVKMMINFLEKEFPECEFRIPKEKHNTLNWSLIKEKSGLKRLDFFIDVQEIQYLRFENAPVATIKNPKWSRNYPLPTIGSIMALTECALNNGQVADLIENNYVESAQF